jgi:hypothetical protein
MFKSLKKMLFLLLLMFTGCYSFTGGSVPGHLKTLNISNVNDLSGFGNPEYKDLLTQSIIDNFQNDNSFNMVETGGDARLNVSISSIRENPIAVSPGELETDRKVEVICEAEFFDVVLQKSVFRKSFPNNEVYSVSEGQSGRDNALRKVIGRLAEDILLAVVSGW